MHTWKVAAAEQSVTFVAFRAHLLFLIYVSYKYMYMKKIANFAPYFPISEM